MKRNLLLSLIFFVSAFMFVCPAADTTFYHKGGDTLTIDMGQPGQPGEFQTGSVIYVLANNYDRTMQLKIGPVFEPSASYWYQRPDQNVSSNHVVALPTGGKYLVRKTIGGITYNATFRIEWVDSMKQTPKLSGKDTICSNNKKYKVSVKKVKDAVKYVWFVNPNSAGVISDTDSVATITPDPAFSGKIQIRALAIFDPMSFMVSQMSFPVDLNIIQGPVSGFDAATDATKKVDFTNTSGNATSYVLKYGDATADYTGTTFTTLSHTYAATGNQSVTLIATIGTCSDTLVKTVNVGRIALYDEAGRVSFYPNPAAETMTVDIQQDGTSPYKIISINGQTVQSGIITSSLSVIDVSGLIPGAYLLRVGNKTVSFIKK